MKSSREHLSNITRKHITELHTELCIIYNINLFKPYLRKFSHWLPNVIMYFVTWTLHDNRNYACLGFNL